jgi:hypothetical protein
LQNAKLEVDRIISTFLLLTSELGARDGSGIKLAITAKNMTPAKNCTTKNFKSDLKANMNNPCTEIKIR